MARIPNVLVLSAGGYGHVPVPLLKQFEPLVGAKSMPTRSLLVSYVGSLGNAPTDLRRRMNATVASHAANLEFGYEAAHGLSSNWANWPTFVQVAAARLLGKTDWRCVMADTRVSLCPRGYGRSSYHLAETVQMGRIPLYLFSDVAWVPYKRLFRRSLGYITDLDGLTRVLHQLRNATIAELESKEASAARLRETHFALPGVMEQIGLFMRAPHHSDLECVQLPSTVRGA